MSVNSSLQAGTSGSGIYFTGLASGVDTDSIIKQLMAISTQQVTNLQSQQTAIQSKQAILVELQSDISALSQAAGALNSASAFNPVTAWSSDTSVATISASSSAAAGMYNLSVTQLAQTEKISSSAQASASQPLSLTPGTFVINGVGITVAATDSLASIAQKINGSGAKVTASVIDGGTNNAYLTLTAAGSGAAGAIQIADLNGSTATSGLGFVASGDGSIREAIAGGATSYDLSSPSTALSTLFGASNVGAKTFNLNGTDISVDFDNQSLQDVANTINASGSGASASVRTVVTNGVKSYKLDITGLTSESDSGGALKALGILQQGYSTEVTHAQDSSFTIDNVAMHTATNTVTSVIPGVTITLLKGTASSPGTSTLSLSQDTQGIESAISTFTTAYNTVMDYIRTNSSFDSSTFVSGPLFGDSTAEQVQSTLSQMVFQNVSGLSGPYTNLASLGFSTDGNGDITTDTSKLESALSTDPAAVGDLFRSVGQSSSDSISYVTSTSKTVPSGSNPYIVEIDQPATEGSYMAATAQTTGSTASETLTFNGALFGNTAYSLILDPGSTLASTIGKINSDGVLGSLVTATNDNGQLMLTSKRYGTYGNFTVASNLAAGSDNSGIGIGAPGTSVTGVNVAGNINNEPATGNGQFLLGNSGNATTAGLQIQYTGTATGPDVGTISVSKGLGALVNGLVGNWTDSINGLFTSINDSLQTQYNDLGTQITDLQTQATQQETQLKTEFSNMESAMAALQQQQKQLTAMLNSLTGTTSSSSSG